MVLSDLLHNCRHSIAEVFQCSKARKYLRALVNL